MPGWLRWLLNLALDLLKGGARDEGREIGRAEANVENLEEERRRVEAANAARRAAERDTAAGRVPDHDPYRRD